MKILILTITAMSAMGGYFFQDHDIPTKDVPKAVINNFEKAFPDARDMEWEKEKDHYEVDFEVEETDFSARYDANGNRIMYKQDIRNQEIPDAVSSALQEDFAKYQVDDVEKVERDGKAYYQIELEGKIFDKKKIFTENGALYDGFNFWD